MKFEDIFNEPGLYKAESFIKGAAFKINNDGYLKFITYKNIDDLFPEENYPMMYKRLFEKEYVKVFNIKELF